MNLNDSSDPMAFSLVPDCKVHQTDLGDLVALPWSVISCPKFLLTQMGLVNNNGFSIVLHRAFLYITETIGGNIQV